MKVKISIIQRENVMSKMKEEYLKKNPPLSEEEIEDQRIKNLVSNNDEEDVAPRMIIIPEINLDDFAKYVDLYFRLDAVRTLYQTPEDAHGKTSMMLLIGNNEYQAVYDEQQYRRIADYLDTH